MNVFRSILFDLGNVLVRFTPLDFWESLGIQDEKVQARIGPQMLELGRIYESGEMSTEEFRARFRELFNGQFADEQLNDAFLSVLSEPIPGSEEIVKRVAERYEIALVSNTNPIHFDLCLRTAPALKHFTRFYVSYELGVLKPRDDFYAGVLRGEGFEPGEMVFIDDLKENVESAQKAGFAGIQFTDATGLEHRLKELGVL